MKFYPARLFSPIARIARGVALPAAAAILAMATAVMAGPVEDAIVERIKPVGTVCVAGEDCAAGLAMAASGPRSGEDVYNAACMACHASGAAGAPKYGVKADWTPRIAKGLDTLYSNSIGGIGAMPAKGLCGNCSDDEIKAAVDYMVKDI